MFDFDTIISHPIYEDPADQQRDQKEVKEMIDKGLDKLTSTQREMLVLHYIEDQSYKEIAEILRIPIGTVGVRIKRAKDALRKVYESEVISTTS
jgi:RNA polymerase sigma factor (sigma-70 family)